MRWWQVIDHVSKPRTLVREVLLAQLGFAAIICVIATASVWWVSNWVVRDNLNDWSQRWIQDVELLGSGFYFDRTDEQFLELESYIARFHEIDYVRYYDRQGQVIYVESREGSLARTPLDAKQLNQLRDIASGESKHIVDLADGPLVRISQAVSSESIVSGNLYTAQRIDELQTEAQLVGFVELGLDYSAYDRDLSMGVIAGIIFVMVAFLLLMVFGRFALLRAVRPLADLQAPLDRIAQGDLEVSVPSSPHREIAAIGDALATAIEKIRERDQHLTKLANFDPLTGLVSRYHFLQLLRERLAYCKADNQSGALLFVDIDQFKYVNDTYGHHAGDRVLTQVAERLRRVFRRDDLLGRLGGDEFVMFVSDVSRDAADAIAEKILAEMREYPLAYNNVSLNARCSVGVAMFEPASNCTAQELISYGDLACREAKSAGRNRARRYRPDAHQIELIRSDVEWQEKLQSALKGDQFELHYQPIMCVSDGTVKHYEVLLRLHDGDALCFPDQFLPAAVRFGLMGELDFWVIDAACKALAEVLARRADVRFSINISGSAFADGTLVGYIERKLDEHRLPADALIFEITEQVAIGSITDAVSQILELRALGVEFAVDDFGTGYSSLTYLKRLPVNFIKIDGAFVQRLTDNRADQTIVRAIADIAHIMGKATIAEFVGDADTLALLSELGVDFAQGFHVGKPLVGIETVLQQGQVLKLRKRSASTRRGSTKQRSSR